MIYVDNAATTMLDIEAFDSMKKYFVENYGNPSQPYQFAREIKKALVAAREKIATCIGADSDEIYFTSGGTESDNWAIKGYCIGNNKKEIIISSIEHHAVLNSAESLKKLGYKVIALGVNKEGIVLPDSLEESLNENVSMVSIMTANNEIGTIQPIKQLAKITHEHGALFHTDAVQALGHIVIDVKKLDVDMLSASAHKFNGPKGIGFLYIKKGINVSPLIDGGMQEKAVRAGTENVPAIIGMSIALKKNCDIIHEEKKYLASLEKRLIDGLIRKNIQFIKNGSREHLPGNISLSFKNADGEMLLHRLDLMGICVSTGAACDSKNTQVSHVIRAIGVPNEYANGTIRISLGKSNTIEEIDFIVEALGKVLNK